MADDCCETDQPDERTLKQIYTELVSHPFFPMLFISEAIKQAVVVYTSLPPHVAYAILALIATVMWAVSDKVEVDVNMTDNGVLK